MNDYEAAAFLTTKMKSWEGEIKIGDVVRVMNAPSWLDEIYAVEGFYEFKGVHLVILDGCPIFVFAEKLEIVQEAA